MKTTLCAIFLAIVSTLGCAGSGTEQPAPSPFEAKITAQTIMLVALSVEGVTDSQTNDLIMAFTLIKQSLLTTLTDDPANLEISTVELVKGIDPVYQDLVDGMVQILLMRIRPYIDAQNPDLQLAMEYVKAVMDGATTALNKHKTRLTLEH